MFYYELVSFRRLLIMVYESTTKVA